MALSQVLTTLLLFAALALANIELSTCQVVKAKVTCLDCKNKDDFSGIKVLVKCDQVKKLAMATTEEDGSFEAKLPSDNNPKAPTALHCLAKLVGGPNQLYASRKAMVSEIVKTHEESNSYTISTPLGFSTSCPLAIKDGDCKAKINEFGSSKTVDLPVPPEWGLAPTSYYVPFIPIIGIP